MNGIVMGIGEEKTVTNPNPGAIIYRVEFVGAGYVEFAVPPGAQFKMLSHGPDINLNIQTYEPAGLKVVSRAESETGGA